MQTFVIVGAGLAGAKAAETLREEGFDGEIVLAGAETDRPYERPPLSKGYLLGNDDRESIFVHPVGWYKENRVDLRAGDAATAIDPAAHTVTLASGETVRYDKLLLATGASARTLEVGGAEAIRYLRTVGESESLRSDFAGGPRVVVIGAGWIGLETAAAARLADCQVTVVEMAPGALNAAIGPELGSVFEQLHRSHGVEFRFGDSVQQVTDGVVRTNSGAELPADLIIGGIGAVPNDQLAAAAGLEVSDGVLTDASLRSSDPDIYAAGDVANWQHPLYGRRVRVEHWGNALTGGPAAARSMLGQPTVYEPVPYFYSDQYDLGMECAGLPTPGSYDSVVYRGSRADMEFIAFWLSGGKVVAGMNVNVWDVSDDIQALIRSGRQVSAERLADQAVPIIEV